MVNIRFSYPIRPPPAKTKRSHHYPPGPCPQSPQLHIFPLIYPISRKASCTARTKDQDPVLATTALGYAR